MAWRTFRETPILYYFDQDGGYLPENEYEAIGDGEAYASYYLKRYYEDNITMKKFASLGDFIIRYIDNEKYRLADSVGLEAKFPYPQIKYIPDDPEYCKPYNNGRPMIDCSPTGTELEEFKSYSEKKLQSLHERPF